MEINPKLVVSILLVSLFAIGSGGYFLTKFSEFQKLEHPGAGEFLLGVIVGVGLSIIISILVSVGSDTSLAVKTVIILAGILLLLLLFLKFIS